MIKEIIIFSAGFVSGVLYSSDALEQNPNKVFSKLGQHASDAADTAKDKIVDFKNDLDKKNGEVSNG